MNNKHITPKEFEQYLKNQGSHSFNQKIENHFNECSFCSEALEGYRISGQWNVIEHSNHLQKKFRKNYKTLDSGIKILTYAASFLLIGGFGFFYFQNASKTTSIVSNGFDENSIRFFVQPTHGPKKLSNKTDEQYWFIGKNNTVAINDAYLKSTELEKAIYQFSPKNAIIVEIQNADYQYSNQIVNRLKQNQKVPVYTISTHYEDIFSKRMKL